MNSRIDHRRDVAVDLLPISLVAHHVFCPRRAWLESVGEKVNSFAMEVGNASHRKVDERKDDRAARRRSVDVASTEVGVVGRCDVVAVNDDETVEVVEFKSAPLRKSTQVTSAQRIQLALQSLCLTSMGYEVVGCAVHFVGSRRSIEVDITESDEAEARHCVELTRDVIEADRAPEPLVDDPRCGKCSHAGVCLPDERQWEAVRRRVQVADHEGQVLHVTVPGSRVSLTKGRIRTSQYGDEIGSVPLEKVSGLVVHGNVDVSGALLRELMWRGLSVVWCSGRGRVVGFGGTAQSPNGSARYKQALAASTGDLDVAREMIASKIANQATLLRRGGGDAVVSDVKAMRRGQRSAEDAPGIPELLGAEGDAASRFFGSFHHLLSDNADADIRQSWNGRHNRGAVDPVNVALNYSYGILLGDVLRAILSCGLDPHLGFVHSSTRNKPALALDLMEQFRPVVADSAVLTALNTRQLTSKHFTSVLGGWRLRDSGRRAVVSSYESRVAKTFKHPVFGYEVDWRRAMEVQARMLLGYLDGTQQDYLGIRVR